VPQTCRTKIVQPLRQLGVQRVVRVQPGPAVAGHPAGGPRWQGLRRRRILTRHAVLQAVHVAGVRGRGRKQPTRGRAASGRGAFGAGAGPRASRHARSRRSSSSGRITASRLRVSYGSPIGRDRTVARAVPAPVRPDDDDVDSVIVRLNVCLLTLVVAQLVARVFRQPPLQPVEVEVAGCGRLRDCDHVSVVCAAPGARNTAPRASRTTRVLRITLPVPDTPAIGW
jgi:hypothetical protein